MKRYVAVLMASAFLSACGGGTNPFTPTPVPGVPPTPDPTVAAGDIPADLAGDVSRITYDPVAGTLTVEGISLDKVPFAATYTRKPGMDVPGYEAYTSQDDSLDRHTTVYTAQSRNEGAVRAAVAVSGGPRNRIFAGGFFERDGNFDAPDVTPTSGLVSYAGTYAGLTNLSGDGGDLIPTAPGTPPELIPTEAAEVTGDVFIQADFGDNTVEGNIFNRVLLDVGALDPVTGLPTAPPTALPSIVLVSTGIQADGTFSGTTVEYEGVLNTDIGDYGGIFGGTNSSGVAGVVHLTQFDGENDAVLGTDSEIEYGVFVLDQCGQPVDAAICANVKP